MDSRLSYGLAGSAAVFGMSAVVVVGWPLRNTWVAGSDHPWAHAAVPIVFAVHAYVVVRAAPRNPIGAMLAVVAAAAGVWALADALWIAGLPAAAWAMSVAAWGWLPPLLAPAALLLIFPDGRPPSPRWRPVVAAVTATFIAAVTASALYPAVFADVPGRAGNPLSIPVSPQVYEGWITPLFAAAGVGVAVAVVSLLWRWRLAEPTLRRQLAWPVLGVLLAFSISLTPASWGLLPFVPLVVPTAVVAAIRWRGLYEVDRVLARSLVYALGTLLIFGLLASVVAVSGWVVGRAGGLMPAIMVTAALATGFDPVRRFLQRQVDRVVYGRRGDPAAAVSRLGTRLDTMLTPAEVPAAIVEVIGQSLGVRQVALLALVEGELRPLANRGGTPNPETALAVSLSGADGPVGRLLVGVRGPGDPLTRADRRLVEQLARHAGTAVHAALLAADLRRARVALVLARDEERRRLRRDLHDGLGSYLAGITFGVDGVRRQVSEPQAAQLARIADQAASASREVRRVIDDLRPGPLEQLGLIDALRDLADRTAGASGLVIAVDCPPSLPRMPLPVELIAYQIASEAFTNVVRHARATQCKLSVAINAARLCLAVIDDGIGLPATPAPGVGMNSMRDRADIMGGRLSVTGRDDGGTAVIAELPLEA